jgi:hypothetical protein
MLVSMCSYNKYFSNCTILITKFVGSPMYLGCRRCKALNDNQFKLNEDMCCLQCGVLEEKKLVVCCLSATVDCVINGNDVSNVLVCKEQDDALFTKSVARCMNDGVSDEESPIGKTFQGVFMLTSSRRLLMKLERMEVANVLDCD